MGETACVAGTGQGEVEEGVLSQEALVCSPTSLTSRPTPRSFLIGEDGLVYEGRGWNIKGDHTGRFWNPMSIGITFMGNYMGECPASQEGERTWALGDGAEACGHGETLPPTSADLGQVTLLC